MLHYEAVKIEPPQKKIKEFNEALKGEGFAGVIDDKEMGYFDNMCKVLAQPAYFHSSELEERQVDVINKMLEFPIDKVFPALDIFRIFLLHNEASKSFSKSDAGAWHIGLLCDLLDRPQAPKAVTMLTLRCLSNIFK